jgi:hypothetical protein
MAVWQVIVIAALGLLVLGAVSKLLMVAAGSAFVAYVLFVIWRLL